MYAPPHHPTRIRCSQPGPQAWSPWALTWRMTLAAALLWTWMAPHLTQAKTFHCGAADTPCLIASMMEANTNGQKTNDIRLEAGTYPLTAVNNNTDGPNGLPSVTSTLTITGDGADTTIIDGGFRGVRLVHVAASGTLTLEGLTLREGSNFSPGGGGIWNRGTVTLKHSTLTRNRGDFLGGGIVNQGTLTITSSALTDNAATESGAILNMGGTVTITDSVLTDNLSEVGCLVNASGTVTIIASTLADNRISGIANRGTVTLLNSTLAHNGGGNIYARGGGIENEGGTVTLINSTLAHNEAFLQEEGGGGIWNSGTITLINSTVADNHVEGRGTGGILNAGGAVRLHNTILAHNTARAPYDSSPDCNGLITSLGYNLIGDLRGCTFNQQSTDHTGEPGLGPFTDTGDPGEGYFPLLSTSPAVNTGNDAACPKTDQLGEKRVGPCDMGAIEFQEKIVSSR